MEKNGSGAAPGRGRAWRALLAAVVLLGVQAAGAASQTAPRPPTQPSSGPGGSKFLFAAVEGRRIGAPPSGYWIFAPDRGSAVDRIEADRKLPVVVFLHGYTALDPERYRAWIDHVVRRGAYVVYPDYQGTGSFGDDWRAFLPNVVDAVGDAVRRLEREEGSTVDVSRVALVGHSLGGVLGAGYAAVATSAGLPPAVALMVAQPGGCRGCERLLGDAGAPLPDLSRVPADTRLIVAVAEADEVVSATAARRIWSETTAVPLEHKDYVTLVGDQRGSPALRATHLLAQTAGPGGTLDALDWYGTWKLLDLLLECAFDGSRCQDAANGSPAQRFMGAWSDGVPVREAIVTDAPTWSKP